MKPKAIEINETKEIEVIEKPNSEEQLSFSDFINDFKI